MDTLAYTIRADREESAAARQARFTPVTTGQSYVDSLRGRNVTVYLFGERIAEPVDHPTTRAIWSSCGTRSATI